MDEPLNDVKPDIEKPNVVELPEPVMVNTASYFFTSEKYKVRDDLINWCRAKAAKAGFTIVIEKSNNSSSQRKQFFRLGCERGGEYKERKMPLKKEDTTTRKCGCPFRLRGYFSASQEWSLSVVCGEHNHKLDEKLEGHILAGRLKPEEKELVHEMTSNLVAPKNILSTLKYRSKDSKTALKQIYNARQRFKLERRGKKTEMQELVSCLEDHKYFYKFRTVGESSTVQDLFLSNPDSVKLFNTFSTVLLMDSTYKTNRYKMPLFEIVGVTSTQMSFSVGFAFIANEKEDNFAWVLETCMTLLHSEGTVPKVIVTDRDTALMNAVAKVLPNTTALVCSYHISKNVIAKCKTLCNCKSTEQTQEELLKTLVNVWNSVIDSNSEEAYVESVVLFRKVFEKFPDFINYVETTILNPLKEKLVRAWTDRVMHIGNLTTNRVESQHGVLKKYLMDSRGDFVRGWEAIDRMLKVQLTEIQTSFGQSITEIEHHFRGHFLYSKLVNNISRNALRYMRGEELRTRECGKNRKKCGCVIRRTYGLPCACLIALKIERKLPIRMDELNSHWKRLRIDDYDVGKDGNVDVKCLTELEAIQERLKSVDYSMKLQIREQLRLIAFPATTLLTPPVRVVETKGAKKKRKKGKSNACDSSTAREQSYWEYVNARFPDSQASQSKPYRPKRKTARIGNMSPNPTPQKVMPFIEYMPLFMHPHIENIINVKGDGHCGFRAIAHHLGKSEEEHILIRTRLIRELNMFRSDYLTVFGSERRLKYISDGLYPPKSKNESGIAPVEKWLTFPDMGHIVATAYNKVVVELTSHKIGKSETFFPLRGRPPPDPFSRIICLGLVPNHFVCVNLKDGCPLPPTCKEWKIHRSEEAASWEYKFFDRQSVFDELMNIEMGDRETNEDDPITLSDDELM